MGSRGVWSGRRARVGCGGTSAVTGAPAVCGRRAEVASPGSRRGVRRSRRLVGALALALGLLLTTSDSGWAQALSADSGQVFAQTAAPGTGATAVPFSAPAASSSASPPPATGAGAPRFPSLGPSQPVPDAEGPSRATSALPAGRTQRCRWDLAGVWEGRGQQTDPTSNSYATRLTVQQFGNYLSVQQPSDGISYYGVCTGDRVELDAYGADGSYIGMQTGTVSGNGRRIESTWVLYRPDYAAGYETLTASGRPSR